MSEFTTATTNENNTPTSSPPNAITPDAVYDLDKESTILIQSNDGYLFVIPRASLQFSTFLSSMMEAVCDDENTENMVTCELVEGDALGRIALFLNHCVEDELEELKPPVPQGTKFEDLIPAWYSNYAKEMTDNMCAKIIIASDYMGIPRLSALLIAYFGLRIRECKTPQEIADMFGIKRKYKTPDMAKLEEKYPMCYAAAREIIKKQVEASSN